MQPIDPAQDLVVVPLDVDHWPEVEAIYPAGIDTGHATFEAKPPAWDDFDATVQGRGIGRLLLGALIQSTEEAGIWTIQSGIFPENTASLRVHRAAGYHTVGTRVRVGKMTYGPMAGEWRDVTFVERRSDRAGV